MTPARTLPLALPLAAIALLAGCSSAASSPPATSAASPAVASAPASAPAATPASSVPVAPASPAAAATAARTPAAAASGAPASAPAGGGSGSGHSPGTVYFAESGNVNGTAYHEPACSSGCLLSGDSTAALYDMTWTSWTGTEAVGTGTEKIDDCSPNCAAGTQHPVRVSVTFSQPVKAGCSASTTRLYWKRASFRWPDGLPKSLSGKSAPVNPLTYPGLGGTSGCA